MELSYIRLDERLDQVQLDELRAEVGLQRTFRRRFLLSWLYHELSLEGVVLSEDDLHRALAGRDGRDYCDDELLKRVRRYREAVRRLTQAAARQESVSRSLLLEYHAIVSEQPPRQPYRTASGPTEQYKHAVVEPEEIEQALSDLLSDLREAQTRIHPIEQAVQAHYRLVKIWPFQEHSAAVARLVANQILYTNGYPPALIHAADRQKYYHALHYDITRLHAVTFESLQSQVALRERLFCRAPASREMAVAL
jgi:Fic family protein